MTSDERRADTEEPTCPCSLRRHRAGTRACLVGAESESDTDTDSRTSATTLTSVLVSDQACLTVCATALATLAVSFIALLAIGHSSDSRTFYRPWPRGLGTVSEPFQAEFFICLDVWVALSGMMLLFVVFSPPRSTKQRISIISLTIVTVCVFVYAAFAFALLPVYRDFFGHALYPLWYVEWLTTTPLMLLLVMNFQSQPASLVRWVLLSDVAMIACGLLASLASRWYIMLMWLTMSYIWELEALVRMHTVFVACRQDAAARQPRVLFSMYFSEMWLYVASAWFPVVWSLAALGVVNDAQSNHFYFLGDVLSKLLYTTNRLIVNLEIIADQEALQTNIRLLAEQMRNEERQKIQAIEANERKQQFLRYLLHEIRMPLNSLVLGVHEINSNSDLQHGHSRSGSSMSTPILSARSPSPTDSLLLVDRSISTPGALVRNLSTTPIRSAAVRGDHEALTLISQATESMTKILEDVLLLQNIDDRAVVLRSERFVMAEVVQCSLLMLDSWITSKSLKVTQSVEPNVPALLGDAVRMQQVLINFLTNAIRFTPEHGHIHVAIRRCRKLESHDPLVSDQWPPLESSPFAGSPSSSVVTLRVSVRDNGGGISSSDLSQMFQSFVQMDTGMSEKGRTTGLGLAITKRIVDMLQGRVGVYSQVGNGSEFFVEAPFRVVSKHTKGDMSQQSQAQQQQQQQQQWEARYVSAPTPVVAQQLAPSPLQLQLLVVEDDAASRKLLVRMLERRFGPGVCQTAEHGARALEMIEEAQKSRSVAHPYDAILCDKEMPVLDGYEAVRHMRDQFGLTCPIIGVTANALRVDQETFMAQGLDAICTKPVNAKKLIDTILQLMDQHLRAQCSLHSRAHDNHRD